MQKGSEMTIENYTATLLMVNFMKFTLFVNDNVESPVMTMVLHLSPPFCY